MKFYRIILLSLIHFMVNCLSAFSQINTEVNDELNQKFNIDDAVERLSQSIRFPTVSYRDTTLIIFEPYIAFIDFLVQSYPLVHRHLERKIINRFSLLYIWEGADTSLLPILFLAHYDVVPVDSNTRSLWQHAPFKGQVDDSYIWGRGTVDDKFQVITLLEAAEQLLKEGFVPNRTIFFAFGHDEETGGENGALQISRYLQSQNKSFEMILDEGGGVTQGIYPGIKKKIAFIATAEKGYMNAELSVRAKGGHASAPPKETAISILAAAISKLDHHPAPKRLVKPVEEMLETLKPYCNKKTKLALNNKWLFKNKILEKLSENQVSNTLVRTVITPTIISGGAKENSLPAFAMVNLNIRILPGDSVGSVMQFMKTTIQDERVSIRISGPYKNPSPVTSLAGEPYRLLKTLINEHFPDAIVAPALSIVTTDTRHYTSLSRNILRFTPVILVNEEKEMVHGYNERISKSNFMDGIWFYYDLMKAADRKF